MSRMNVTLCHSQLSSRPLKKPINHSLRSPPTSVPMLALTLTPMGPVLCETLQVWSVLGLLKQTLLSRTGHLGCLEQPQTALLLPMRVVQTSCDWALGRLKCVHRRASQSETSFLTRPRLSTSRIRTLLHHRQSRSPGTHPRLPLVRNLLLRAALRMWMAFPSMFHSRRHRARDQHGWTSRATRRRLGCRPAIARIPCPTLAKEPQAGRAVCSLRVAISQRSRSRPTVSSTSLQRIITTSS